MIMIFRMIRCASLFFEHQSLLALQGMRDVNSPSNLAQTAKGDH
jgi:hypothetical protein